MKYRLGSLTIEAIDTYVRVTVENVNGTSEQKHAVTKHQCPSAAQVAQLVAEVRGYWPDGATLRACGRAADDARNNKTVLAL